MSRNLKSAAVLVSGGLDSVILLAEATKRYRSVFPLYVKSGHIWEAAEINSLKRFLKRARDRRIKRCAYLTLTASDLYPKHWSLTGKSVPGSRSRDRAVYLPGKNILLIAKAAVFCALKKIPVIVIGSLSTNPFHDASRTFFRQMGRAVSRGLGFQIKIKAPLLKQPKK